MGLDLRFADEIRRVRQETEAALASDDASRLDTHRRIRATIDLEVESLLAAAAAKRRAFDEDRVERHRDRERARGREERLRADTGRARAAAAARALAAAAPAPAVLGQAPTDAREHL